MSLRQVGRGLRQAIVDPIAEDERNLYAARHANPTLDLAASQHPAYGVPAAIQDIAHGGNPLLEAAGALPLVGGIRRLHAAGAELAKQGAKGRRAADTMVGSGYAVAGTNVASRGEEIMNPGEMPYAR